MLSTTYSATLSGVNALQVTVEANSGEVTPNAFWWAYQMLQLRSPWIVFFPV